MVKTAEFGQPCFAVPQPGRCRICGTDENDVGLAATISWADESRTVCVKPACIAEVKREIGR